MNVKSGSYNVNGRRLRGVLTALLLSILGVLSLVGSAHAEHIRRFDTDLKLTSNGLLDVMETIQVDFGVAQRHGIYRTIPVAYARRSDKFTLQLALLSVTDAKGVPYRFTQMKSGNDLKICIGNAQKLITGQHTYRLHYTVNGAVQVFGGKPELYWNVTGNEWPYAIDAASVHFYPPTGDKATLLSIQSFVGPLGSRAAATVKTDAKSVVISTGKLPVGSGLTFVVALPASAVRLPHAKPTPKPRTLSAALKPVRLVA